MTKTPTMSGRRRRRRTALPACLACAMCSPHVANVEAFSPFRHVATSSQARADIPPTLQHNNSHAPIATIATAATMALGILAASPLPSHASDAASPSDITASILRRQVTTKLSETEAFQRLRREPPTTRALRELTQLQDLQDARLDACADRGTLWEQCFMFGDSASDANGSSSSGGGGNKAQKGATNLQNGLDYQYLSPMGALESGNSNDQTLAPITSARPKTKVPTW